MIDTNHRPMSKAELEAYIADDFIPAMRKMLPVIASLPEWQPIETAPTDKEVLLACLGHDGLRIGQKMYTEDTKSDLLNTCWVIASSGNVCQPTHWMPLPKPPIP